MSKDKLKKGDLTKLPGQVDEDVAAHIQGGAWEWSAGKPDLNGMAMNLVPSEDHSGSRADSGARADSWSGWGAWAFGGGSNAQPAHSDTAHADQNRSGSNPSTETNPASKDPIKALSGSEHEGPAAGKDVKARASSLADPSASHKSAEDAAGKPRSASVSETSASHDSAHDHEDVRPRAESAPAKLSGPVTLVIDGEEGAKDGAAKPGSIIGDVTKEAGKLPAQMFKQAAAAQLAIQAALIQESAKEAGTFSSSGSMKLDSDAKPKTVTSEDGKTAVTQGTYGGGYAGALAYHGELGGGAVVAAGYEGGWTSNTIVKQDRFGAQIVETETWANATFAVGAKGEAHANDAGAQIKVKIKAEVGADKGVSVSVTDEETGVTYTKMGQLSVEASASGEAQARVTWERASLSIKGQAGASASASGSLTKVWDSGTGLGIGGEAKIFAEATAEVSAAAYWNPVDGYGTKIKNEASLDYGVAVGLSPKVQTAVASIMYGSDAVFGSVGAHADIDFNYKDGKFSTNFDIGGALGVGGNFKFGVDVDVKKLDTNMVYNHEMIYNTSSHGTSLGYSNPGAAVAEIFVSIFKSAPESKAEAVTLDYWVPANIKIDTLDKILKGSATSDEAMKFFGEALTKYSVADQLKKECDLYADRDGRFWGHAVDGKGKFFDNGRDYVDQLKSAKAFAVHLDPTDPASFSFTPGKNAVHDLSDRCEKWFPASTDPKIKAMELTFNSLPPGFDKDFKLIKGEDGTQKPDGSSAFAIFGQCSLVQYLSVEAFEKISNLDKPAMKEFLKSSACDYLTDASKTKLETMWTQAYDAGALPLTAKIYGAISGLEKSAMQDYLKSDACKHLTSETKAKLEAMWNQAFDAGALSNPYAGSVKGTSLSLADTSLESKLWDVTKSASDAAAKQAEFKTIHDQFATLVKNSPGSVSGAAQLQDDTKSPRGATGEVLVKFSGVPLESDGWHVIDLSEAKKGKIGLNDLLYDYTMEKLDKLGSPYAVYQFLTGPKSAFIADEASRGALFNAWLGKHGSDDWRTATDPDAVRAQAWFDNFTATADFNPYNVTPAKPLSQADTSFEAKFWELSKFEGSGAAKQDQFKSLYAAFNTSVSSGAAPIQDNTHIPRDSTGDMLVKFSGVARGDDGWHLIDLSAAKQGTVGLNDLSYDHTIETLRDIKTPQAAYQFLSAADWIADGPSRLFLMQDWFSKNKDGQWRTGTDAVSRGAQAWYEENKFKTPLFP